MNAFVRGKILGNLNVSEWAVYIFYILCLYAAVSITYTGTVLGSPHVYIRIVVAFLILLTFVILERSSLDNDNRAFLTPFLLIFYVTGAAFYFTGDFLIYTYTIGVALISLTYMSPKGLVRYLGAISTVQFVLVVVMGQNLLGINFTMMQNYMALLTSIGVNFIIYLFCIRCSKALADLTEAKNVANDAAKAKGVFLSNMSHEIRTPLNAIIGMTAVGKSGSSSAEAALDKIENASQHLLGIVNDILDMSKLESGKLELASEHFNFKEMVGRIVNIMHLSAQDKQQELLVSLDDKIPTVLIGDDQRLTQVIMNLLSNAIKFTPNKGKVELNAYLINKDDEDCTIEISVTDSGIGISSEQQDNLFNVFFQAETSTSRKFGGTGLGLAISKNIVNLMDGSIKVQSELGKGASFIFTIKIRYGNQVDIVKIDKNDVDLSIGLTGNILIAEDIEINRDIIVALLEPTGLGIVCVENGVQAVHMFSEAPEKFDLIFMDVQMPEMDGYNATRNIRKLDVPQAKTIPIIAMTANVMKEDIEKCLRVGMDGHIGKPIELGVVLKTIKEYLNVKAG
ncbi:MAG: ATP-binding protein [Defluviitaleaceae bacterium]|nr:ATP-binding protein [Defluviitaleaceae bacterium]